MPLKAYKEDVEENHEVIAEGVLIDRATRGIHARKSCAKRMHRGVPGG